MDSLRFTTVAVALLLLSFLHSPTEAEGGVCTEIQGSCLETSSCTRLCLESKGDKMVKSECRPPEVNPGTPPISYTMCFCSYICDQTSEETM
ncbi:unnamed protein product [Brassica oleracea var. botrytis]|uniref:Defensin-like protein n=2 Tax=Brassica TaxID=3705 RepID=A0ABQ8BAS1_BRANA|nr:hypothetical protein F2Q68_00029717 [Brassica cretica]KAH0901909.1 hypothetical protein HID58_041412 [Brassica napus]